MTITPQPLAVTTIASTSRSTCGHHASMLRLTMRDRPLLAAQVIRQRAAAAAGGNAQRARCRCGRARAPSRRRCRARARPARSRPAPASCGDGARAGHDAGADARPGSFARRSAGSSGFSTRPIASAPANSGRASKPSRSSQRLPRATRPADAARRRRWRPMSTSRPYSDAGRTRGLATAAREAAIEVQLRLRRDLAALEHLLDQVDAAARTVEFVAQQLIRRARRRAEPAVHAGAQDRVGLAAVGRVADEIGERGLHGSVPAGRPRALTPPRGAAN